MKKLPEASVFEIALLLFAFRSRYRVEGDSMLPLLEHGDEVLVHEGAGIEVGDIVIARHPHDEKIEMVKRVAGSFDNGKYFSLLGDNPPESTDSREFGLVEKRLIIGKVECLLK
jgi:nickel-type superoxide dismutase maturation protease